jgi:hypothetical protein
MKINTLFSILGISVVFVSCQPNGERNDSKAVAREMRSRKIRRITDAQILNKTNELGEKVITSYQVNWSKKADSSMSSCVPFFEAFAKAQEKGVQVRRLPFAAKSLSKAFGSIETQLFEAYRYNVANNIALTPNVQKSGDTAMFYTAPLLLDASCMKCHGEQGAAVQALQKKYPNDTLTNFKSGQAIGIWSVRLSKPEIILQID